MNMRSVLSLVAALACPAVAIAEPAKTIAVTIDDIPILSRTPVSAEEVATVNAGILKALRANGVKAVGFVNEDRLLVRGKVDAGIEVLDAWLSAGMELGNHNFGHLGLWNSSLEENQDAVLKGEVFTRWLAARHGAPLRYYRHPFTQTGRDEAEKLAFEAFLKSRGYTVAPYTIEHDDYLYSCVYDKLEAGADKTAQGAVAADYLAHLKESVRIYESMSEQLFGRQVPQVLLIHATRLNAETLDRTLSTLREMGYSFITLEAALRDEAYRSPADASKQFGPSWLARWARAKARKLTAYGQPDPADQTAELASKVCAE